MCLAIVKPAGSSISREHVIAAFAANPDGGGVAYAHNGKLSIVKGFFDAAEFADMIESLVDSIALIHFRFATHGHRNADNCHPWKVCHGKYAMIHNGVIPIPNTPAKSDSGHFADEILTPLFHKMRPQAMAARYLIERAIGASNKICLLDAEGDYVIYNEQAGHWMTDAWYSNYSYESYDETYEYAASRIIPVRAWRAGVEASGKISRVKFFKN